MEKILCPYHKEDTPSMVVYDNGYAHCFGCFAHVRVEALGRKFEQRTERRPEPIGERLAYIRALPKGSIRGLSLPVDAGGYYVLWPDEGYFKYRAYAEKTASGKYRGPAGHPKPLFICPGDRASPVAIIVEGEINALSIARVLPAIPVYSPGGAGDFYSKRAVENDLPIYVKYEKLLILADKDAAGAIAAIELRARLEGRGPKVRIKLMASDANDLLVWGGDECLKEEICEALEM